MSSPQDESFCMITNCCYNLNNRCTVEQAREQGCVIPCLGESDYPNNE